MTYYPMVWPYDIASSSAEEGGVLEFAFDTASPTVIPKCIGLPINTIIHRAEIELETVFDDLAATISIGDAGDNARYMPIAGNNVGLLGRYKANIKYKLLANSNINLYITPATSIQGAGTAFLFYKRP